MNTTTILTLAISLGWAVSVLAIAWITQRHEAENRATASEHQAYLLTAMQYVMMAKSQDPVATGYALQTAQTQPEDMPDPEPQLAPITGFKISGGEQVELLEGDFEGILSGADEDVLIRED